MFSAIRSMKQKDNEAMLNGIVAMGVVIALIAIWPKFATAHDGLLFKAGDALGKNISGSVMDELHAVITKNVSNGEKAGLFSNPREFLSSFLFTICLVVAQVVMGLAKAVQYFLVEVSFALSPLFLSLFCLQAGRKIAMNFVLVIIGLALWDLSWAFVDVGPHTIYKAMYDLNWELFMPGLIVIWVVGGYILAPKYIVKALTQGGDVGGAMLGAGMAAGGMVVSTAMKGLDLAAPGAGTAASAATDAATKAAAKTQDSTNNLPTPDTPPVDAPVPGGGGSSFPKANGDDGSAPPMKGSSDGLSGNALNYTPPKAEPPVGIRTTSTTDVPPVGTTTPNRLDQLDAEFKAAKQNNRYMNQQFDNV
jgi:hypothetical protein